ncbi:MAG: hypothetical protein M3436_18085 [Pseudomonadota bacterium]|nr:hypothetical protein [Pseudomonadota bacterium]
MAITTQLWTISGLSIELVIDRRTLAKRLASLRPDDMRTEGGKQIKRWRLSRVLAHLQGNGKSEAAYDREALEEMVCRSIYPAVVSSRYFRGLTINYLRQDLGVPTVDALRAYQVACLGLCYALAEFFKLVNDSLDGVAEREEIPPADLADFEVLAPSCFEELKNIGPEAYAAKYWPDKAAEP